jgi:hypothetical protein
MYDFIKTEKGWKICWGGAALHAAEAVRAEPELRPVIRVAEPRPQADERDPAKTLSA